MKDSELNPSFRQFGWTAYEAGEFQAARKVATVFLEWNEDDGDAHQLLGLICYAECKYTESVAELEVASLLQPVKLKSRICLAHGYAWIGLRSLAYDLLRDLANEEIVAAELALHIASGLNLVGRPDMALRSAQKVINRDDQVAQAWYDYGYYTGRCGGSDSEVELTTSKAISLDPGNSTYRVGLAGLLFQQNRMDEAIKVIQSLTDEHISAIDCLCCIEKVVALYRQADDGHRALKAVAQLKKLRSEIP